MNPVHLFRKHSSLRKILKVLSNLFQEPLRMTYSDSILFSPYVLQALPISTSFWPCYRYQEGSTVTKLLIKILLSSLFTNIRIVRAATNNILNYFTLLNSEYVLRVVKQRGAACKMRVSLLYWEGFFSLPTCPIGSSGPSSFILSNRNRRLFYQEWTGHSIMMRTNFICLIWQNRMRECEHPLSAYSLKEPCLDSDLLTLIFLSSFSHWRILICTDPVEMGTGGNFRRGGGVKRPVREVDNSPPSTRSVVVKNGGISCPSCVLSTGTPQPSHLPEPMWQMRDNYRCYPVHLKEIREITRPHRRDSSREKNRGQQ
jgi:hypothetical protein